MVDVGRRMNTHAHLAGLKRLSARASKRPVTTIISPPKVCFSLTPFARNVIHCLRKCEVQIVKGLSEEEFVKIEATFGFTFPPDLKAILHEGLPLGLGFPDWRAGSLQQLRMTLNLPIAGLSYEVSRGRFWTKLWGPMPLEPEQAVRIARAALKKVPILIPLFYHCYIPSSPDLIGNPVFFVHQSNVFISTYDLADFFEQEAFISSNQKAPSNFTSIEASCGRASSLGGGTEWAIRNGSSFRIENATNSITSRRQDTIDLGTSRDVGREADWTEEPEAIVWKCEEPWRDPESWGRNLDTLAKKYGERPRRSVDRQDARRAFRFSDFYVSSADNSPRLVQDAICNIRERCTSEISFTHFTAKAVFRTPKIARRIEFWSDVAEKPLICGSYDTTERMFSLSKVDVDLSKSSLNEHNCNGLIPADLLDSYIPRWLVGFFQEMATILRRGGWKDEDITETFSVAPSSQKHENAFLDRQSMLEELVLHVNLLSDALRRAGWSTQEVAEALDVGLSFHDERRRPNRIPSHLSAQIMKLAEYVASS